MKKLSSIMAITMLTVSAIAQTVVTNYAPGSVVATTVNGVTTVVTNPPVPTSVTITPNPVTTPIAGVLVPVMTAPLQSDAQPASVTPSGAISLLQGYLVVNDTTYNGWQSNHLDLWQAAVFQNVAGTPGASAVGNVLGLEVPVWRTASLNAGFHLESLTDFETVFGDVGWQGIGIGYDYNIHQVQISGEIDGDLGLKGPFTGTVAPGIEFKKASTSLGGVSPLFRWEIPIRHQTGFGRVFVGMQVPL